MKGDAVNWYCPRCLGRMEEESEPNWYRCADCGERVHVNRLLTLGEKIEQLKT
jgi:DNA-directed RNA polymerase subunit RPC12/RpoP